MVSEHNILSAPDLVRAGRSPELPFALKLADGRLVSVSRLLRVVPGKRYVGEGLLDGVPVLVKLFIASRAARHWSREIAGIKALQQAGIPTPPLLLASQLADGKGHVLLTAFLDAAHTLAAPVGEYSLDQVNQFEPAFWLLGKLHGAGLIHTDLHGGNFLLRDDEIYLLDGDAVKALSPGKPLAGRAALRNLAILAAQLPELTELLISAYSRGNPAYVPDLPLLGAEARKLRRAGGERIAKKVFRNTTRYAVKCGFFRYSAVLRPWKDELATLLHDLDGALSHGRLLKDGGSSTVVAIDTPSGPAVLKRYNLKSPWHAFLRLWQPSRAWNCWRAGKILEDIGVRTPRQLAIVEERFGLLRRRAWLIAEFCPGTALAQHLAADRIPVGAEAEGLLRLFATLHREQISHGDLKASNILCHQGKFYLIDLDATTRHHHPQRFARSWRKDRARLLANWPEDSMLRQWLDESLPH